MNDKRLDRIELKMDELLKAFSNYRVKSEKRITKLETVQGAITALLGTAVASFFSVVVYLINGGKA